MISPFAKEGYARRIAVGCFFALALFFATYQLTESPSFWYDEGWYFQSAANLVQHGAYGIQFSPGSVVSVSKYQSVSYPLTHVLALWFRIFGISVASGRALMVCFILGLLAIAYTISKRIFGPNIALGTLALLATFAPLYGNGKSILGETPGLVYLGLSLLSFNRACSMPKKKLLWVILSAAFAGLCMATKPFFFLLVPALAIGIFVAWRRKLLSGKEIAIAGIFTLIPILIWVYIQLGPHEALSDAFAFYANPYAYDSAAQAPSMLSVVWRSVRSLFGDASTIYTLAIMAVWSASVAVKAFSKARIRISVEELVAFIFSVLACLAFLRIGTIFRYFYAAQILALVFLPNALVTLAQEVSLRFMPRWPGFAAFAKQSVPVAAIAALALLGVYQILFSSWVAGAYGSHKTAYWQGYFAALPVTTTVFFYDVPEVVPFMRTDGYYQLLVSDRRSPPGAEGLPLVVSGSVDEVIIQTSKYEPLKDTLFRAYAVEDAPYKYSILKPRRRSGI